MLALAGIWWAADRFGDTNREALMEETIDFECANGHAFTMTVWDVNQHHLDHYGERIPCAVCGSTETFPSVGESTPGRRTRPGG